MTGVLDNPVKSGYLWCMSGREHNSENIQYMIKVDSFKDAVRDDSVWNSDIDYKSIDVSIPDFEKIAVQETDDIKIGGETKWPSLKVSFEVFKSNTLKIWNDYLSKNSSEQICMPAKVLNNTLRRLQFLHLYGPSVFDETLIDPKKTLKTDMMPRFIVSPCFKRMQKRLDSLFPLPPASDLKLNVPPNRSVINLEDNDLTMALLKEISLETVLQDQLLYKEFLRYLKKHSFDENLLFVQAVSLFKTMYNPENKCKDPNWLWTDVFSPEAEDMGWTIFKFFICPGSAYDIGLSFPRRKDIMHYLARPIVTMFDAANNLAKKVLFQKWIDYKATKEFETLPNTIKDYKLVNQKDTQKDENYISGWLTGKFSLFRSSKYKYKSNGSYMNKIAVTTVGDKERN